MKKRILFTGLLLLLTLGTFAVTPVAPDKTHAPFTIRKQTM